MISILPLINMPTGVIWFNDDEESLPARGEITHI
jgi:hypothetical protein